MDCTSSDTFTGLVTALLLQQTGLNQSCRDDRLSNISVGAENKVVAMVKVLVMILPTMLLVFVHLFFFVVAVVVRFVFARGCGEKAFCACSLC